MSAAALLARLDRVHQTGPDRWRAVCPAHKSKHRSQTLAIRELPDGMILVKCFGGCEARDVVCAAGLEMRDLFPAHMEHRRTHTPTRIAAADVLACVDHEITVAMLILQDVIGQKTFNTTQLERLSVAAERMSDARNYAAPARAKAAT